MSGNSDARDPTQRRICVVGLGYIGLPTAALFASHRVEVVGLDINEATVATINQGRIHIVEPGLDQVVTAAVANGHLRATTSAEPADAFLIAVPTPFTESNREPDLSYIEGACRNIAAVLRPGNLIVLESTSPVGATEQMSAWLADMRPDLTFPQIAGASSDIRIAHCPERVLPGKVMEELVSNDRIIGGMTSRCAEQAVELYRTFVRGDCIVTDTRTAEMAKLVENSFRDVNIAFANELSMICAKLQIDVWELIGLANRHPRVNILQPGPGVGGHCIAVDPWFIVAQTPDQARLIRTAREVNDSKPEWVLSQIRAAVAASQTSSAGAQIALYGLAFKANIDDLRESPALMIARQLAVEFAGHVVAVEPNIDRLRADEGFELVSIHAASRADVHVLLVDHREFKDHRPVRGAIIDTRGMW